LGCTLGEELLRPTKIYVKSVLTAVSSGFVHGIAHITGGGFIENIPRMLPDGFGVEIKKGSWEISPIFTLLKNKGSLEEEEMFKIFNMGIGMVLAVEAEKADELIIILNQLGEEAKRIGHVIQGKGVQFT
jgi:phosphoribosylformylglycinamidine cyclo-ligase